MVNTYILKILLNVFTHTLKGVRDREGGGRKNLSRPARV